MSKTIGVGLIGSQFIFSIHARSLQECPRADTIAVSSPTAGTGRKVELPFSTDAAKPIDLWKRS